MPCCAVLWCVYVGPGRSEAPRGYRAIKAHVECSHCFPSFGRFEWVLGPFWAKRGCFGSHNAQLREGTF